jgi:CRISP-associated protein Cas1
VPFERDENGMLTKDTRHLIADKINERLDSEASFESKRYPLRSVIQMQARHIATFLRGERINYEAFQMPW